MTKFEFLMMIASVVIAIGMTEIVGGWGRLARTPAEISFDWLHFCWTLYILLSSIQYWIGMWSYAGAPFEYTFQIYFLVVPTLFLVFSAGFMVLAGLADLVIVGSKAVGAQAFIALPLAALFVLPALTSRVWVHAVALTLLGLFLVLFLLGEVSALDFDQRWPR
jgi:hypothetical protein